MASLDLLDYQTGLEEALARPGPDGRPLLEPSLRKQALRDVRRTVDALAFRYALLDDRPMPEDLDYIRALECLKAPAAVAGVLARRRPTYRKTRVRRLATTWITLGILVLFVGGLGYAATLEAATELASINERRAAGDVVERTFLVDENVTRLRVDGTIVVSKGADTGLIYVALIGPDGREHLGDASGQGMTFAPSDGNYLRENVYSPASGEWTLRVYYAGAGSVLVTVDGITPTR